jgi:hypothetical protein
VVLTTFYSFPLNTVAGPKRRVNKSLEKEVRKEGKEKGREGDPRVVQDSSCSEPPLLQKSRAECWERSLPKSGMAQSVGKVSQGLMQLSMVSTHRLDPSAGLLMTLLLSPQRAHLLNSSRGSITNSMNHEVQLLWIRFPDPPSPAVCFWG